MLSIAQQEQSLRVAFPQFSSISLSATHGVWEGWIRTRDQQYMLRIDYELPPHFALRYPVSNYYPRVYVTEPYLKPNYRAELGPLPHVWYDKPYLGQPNLCLFHPQKGEWDYTSSIANTTLPDACEWIHAYELWRVNGRWYGGGENHAVDTSGKKNNVIEKIRRDALSGASKITLAA